MKAISRRTVLRGVGTTLALPLLEAMAPLAASASGQERAPLRALFVFVPGGVNVDMWTPQGEGAGYRFSPTLSALEPVRQDVLVLTGLDNRRGETGGNGHPLGCAPWLSSAPLNQRDTGGYCTDISIDQVARECGFGSSVTLRQRFASAYATTPTSYRQRFAGREQVHR